MMTRSQSFHDLEELFHAEEIATERLWDRSRSAMCEELSEGQGGWTVMNEVERGWG